MTPKRTESPHLSKIILGIFVAVLFALFHFLNRLYPIILDDWTYSFVYYTTDRVGSFGDAIESQYKHYFMWGGRSVVHVILQTVLYWGEQWADLLNAAAFVGLVSMMYLFANKSNKIRPSLFLLIFLSIWFFNPDMGETTLWLTGSINYLWGTLFILMFLYPFYCYFTETVEDKRKPKKYKSNPIYYILFFVCGVITGWTNENTVAAMLLIILIFYFLIWKTGGKIETWSVVGFVGAVVGFAFMFLAPGNYRRYSIELQQMDIHSKPSFDFYWTRFQTLYTDFFEYGWMMLALFALIFIIYISTSTKRTEKPVVIYSLFFVLMSLVSAMAMIASPVFFPRTWFGIFIFFILAIAMLYANLDFEKLWIKYTTRTLLTICSFLFIFTCYQGTEELIRLHRIVDQREQEVNKQKAEGKEHIVLSGGRFEKRNDLIIPKMYDFPQDTTLWMFQEYNRYHGVKSTRIEN